MTYFLSNFIVILVIVLAGCGKSRQSAPWPAAIALPAISAEQAAIIRGALRELNETSGKEVTVEAKEGAHFPIAIEISELQEKKTLAGLSILEEDQCIIRLSPSLFTPEKSAYLTPVLWHEIGHCAGLEHDGEEGELMYATTKPMDRYEEGAFSRFFEKLFSAAGAL